MLTATLLIMAFNNTNNKMLSNKNELTTFNNTDVSHKHSIGPQKPYIKEYFMFTFILRLKVNKTKLQC